MSINKTIGIFFLLGSFEKASHHFFTLSYSQKLIHFLHILVVWLTHCSISLWELNVNGKLQFYSGKGKKSKGT
jgi:hypothetical protein